MNKALFSMVFKRHFGTSPLLHKIESAMYRDLTVSIAVLEDTVIQKAPNISVLNWRTDKLFESTNVKPIAAVSSRCINGIHFSGIRFVCQLVLFSEQELMNKKNIGRKSVFWLATVLAEHGLYLGMSLSDYTPPNGVLLEKGDLALWNWATELYKKEEAQTTQN